MTDYNPNPGPSGYDRYGNARYDPPEPGGRGPYILLAILVLIGLVGGLLYFNSAPREDDVAKAPADRSMTTTTPGPAPTTPAMPGGGPGGPPGGTVPANPQ